MCVARVQFLIRAQVVAGGVPSEIMEKEGFAGRSGKLELGFEIRDFGCERGPEVVYRVLVLRGVWGEFWML